VAMGIGGQTEASALCFRDKVIMKEILEKNLPSDVREYFSTPICARVSSASTIIKFVALHSLPIVVKPTRGMGSMDTYLIHSEGDLKQMMTKGVATYPDGPIDYEVEKFCVGKMYHIDGFVLNGVCRVIWPSTYINTCSGFQNSKFLGSHSLHKDNPLTPRLQKCVVEILKALDQPPSYSFHVEVFHTPEDKFVFCEAACRTGGAGVSGVFTELMGCDLNKAIVQVQCGDEPTWEFPDSWENQQSPEGCAGWIVVYPKIGELASIPLSGCPYEEAYSYVPTNKKIFFSREHCTDALGSFLVRAKTEDQVTEFIEKSVTWLLENTVWK